MVVEVMVVWMVIWIFGCFDLISVAVPGPYEPSICIVIININIGINQSIRFSDNGPQHQSMIID